jgi:hypothetical protein
MHFETQKYMDKQEGKDVRTDADKGKEGVLDLNSIPACYHRYGQNPTILTPSTGTSLGIQE